MTSTRAHPKDGYIQSNVRGSSWRSVNRPDLHPPRHSSSQSCLWCQNYPDHSAWRSPRWNDNKRNESLQSLRCHSCLSVLFYICKLIEDFWWQGIHIPSTVSRQSLESRQNLDTKLLCHIMSKQVHTERGLLAVVYPPVFDLVPQVFELMKVEFATAICLRGQLRRKDTSPSNNVGICQMLYIFKVNTWLVFSTSKVIHNSKFAQGVPNSTKTTMLLVPYEAFKVCIGILTQLLSQKELKAIID